MDIKKCHVALSDMQTAGNAALGLKAGLSRWKASVLASQTDGEGSDPELEPVNLISVRNDSVKPSHKSSAISLDNLLVEYKDHKPKVEILINEDESSDGETENEELRNRMRQENELGLGKIRRIAPGITWLQSCTPVKLLSNLPMADTSRATLCQTDVDVIALLKCPSTAQALTSSFTLLCQLVKDKCCLLNNMFIAMCLHSRSSAVEALRECLKLLLTHKYDNKELDSWTPQLSHIMTVIRYLGAAEDYSECPEESPYSLDSSCKSQRIININIKAFLDSIACSCKFRKSHTAGELMELFITVAKLSLDRTLICKDLMTDFQHCLHAIISVPDEGEESETSFSNLEHELCRRLLSTVKHHHNKLHLVTMIPTLSSRAVDLRMTLAYLAICQLLEKDNDLSDPEIASWSMNMLAHKYFSMAVDDSNDMYLLYTLISLFDIAVGQEIESSEKEELEAMRKLMSQQCGQLTQNPMRPDITTTKFFMHRVTFRWDWVVRQATALEELLDIKYKPTPTKIIPVDSQEVYDDDDDDVEDIGFSVSVDDDETIRKAVKRPLAFSHREVPCEVKVESHSSATLSHSPKKFTPTPTISPAGLERLRNAAREICGVSPTQSRSSTPGISISSASSHSPRTALCSTPTSSSLMAGEDSAGHQIKVEAYSSPSHRKNLLAEGESSSNQQEDGDAEVDEFLPDLD